MHIVLSSFFLFLIQPHKRINAVLRGLSFLLGSFTYVEQFSLRRERGQSNAKRSSSRFKPKASHLAQHTPEITIHQEKHYFEDLGFVTLFDALGIAAIDDSVYDKKITYLLSFRYRRTKQLRFDCAHPYFVYVLLSRQAHEINISLSSR